MIDAILFLSFQGGKDRTDKDGREWPGFGIVPRCAQVLQGHVKFNHFPKAVCGTAEELRQRRISIRTEY